MEKYVVTCPNPLADLKIDDGDEVSVQGTNVGGKITAKSIRNITKNSANCGCETGTGIMFLIEEVEAVGLARNISITSGYLQFTLDAKSVKKLSLEQSNIPIHPKP